MFARKRHSSQPSTLAPRLSTPLLGVLLAFPQCSTVYPFHKMRNSFTQKFLLVVFAGFCAACLIWFFRNIIETSFRESGAGWREIYIKPTPRPR